MAIKSATDCFLFQTGRQRVPRLLSLSFLEFRMVSSAGSQSDRNLSVNMTSMVPNGTASHKLV